MHHFILYIIVVLDFCCMVIIFFLPNKDELKISEGDEFYCSRQLDDTYAYISSIRCLHCFCLKKYLLYVCVSFRVSLWLRRANVPIFYQFYYLILAIWFHCGLFNGELLNFFMIFVHSPDNYIL